MPRAGHGDASCVESHTIEHREELKPFCCVAIQVHARAAAIVTVHTRGLREAARDDAHKEPQAPRLPLRMIALPSRLSVFRERPRAVACQTGQASGRCHAAPMRMPSAKTSGPRRFCLRAIRSVRQCLAGVQSFRAIRRDLLRAAKFGGKDSTLDFDARADRSLRTSYHRWSAAPKSDP